TVGSGNFLHGIALSSSKLFTAGSVPFIDDDGLTVTASGGFSNYLIPKIIDHLLGSAAFTFDTSVFLALYTTNPTAADSGTEASGGGYARLAIDFNTASGGSASNTDLEDFGTASANIGTISHFGIRDNSPGGNLHVFGAWNTALAVNSGDTYRVPAGNLTVALD
ncbi:MAG TPA: hypothetical protein VHC46_03225, partial [Thermodesulfobacteriota bacterium]|nr:hypothetical protein [Thermodesulfobacteriota bacterium]